MDGKKGSKETIIPVTNDTSNSDVKAQHPENSTVKAWVISVWSFAKEDTSRVIFAFKVGLAVLLVSLLTLIQAPYDVLGPDIIWSIITVVIMFEYTVGMTFNRGFNRALGSLLAVVLAVSISQIAHLGGRIARPVIIGISIFVVGALTSFLKQWPSLVPYEYGFRVILFTFCLIINSGYHMGNPTRTAIDRMYSIAIGGFVAVFVNLLIFPMWAGEQLHKELVDSFNGVSDSLEGGVAHQAYILGSYSHYFRCGTFCPFTPQWPSLVPYEYGFCVILFTFCLIINSGYHMGNPTRTAIDRMYSIAIGGFVAVFVNLLIFPMWAGEQLHKELVDSFNGVSDSLEECVRRYFEDDGSSDVAEFTKNVLNEFPGEPAYKKCKNILNSSAKIDGLASTAKWEPPHGRFNHFFYPWSEYVKVGAILRYCAYEVMALHGVLHSEIQAPYNLRITFQSEMTDATNQAVELLRSLGKDVSNMKTSLQYTSLLKRVHSSTERLQDAISLHSYYLLTCSHVEPQKLCHIALSPSSTAGNIPATGTYHETMRKDSRRLISSRMESSAVLSLATFSSLLIEFVARLDHLVDAVDQLSRMAKFKDEDL